ncbi:MAG: major capsid protein [Blastocatellia bacterium]
MPMLNGQRWLNSLRLKTILFTLAAKLDIQRPLRFLNRTAKVEAFDDELIGRFTGTIYAADILSDDQEAVTYETGKLQLVSYGIPNLKLGQRISQAILNRMSAMQYRSPLVTEVNALEQWEMRLAENLVMGVRQRMNAMICAMQIDSFNYNRLGLQISGSWGMPADLKVTPATPWTDPVNATPISDIQVLRNHALDVYGVLYDRMTLSHQAFDYMVSTQEFRNRATALYGFAVIPQAVNIGDRLQMEEYAGRILNMTIEIDDAVYNERRAGGAFTRIRTLPANTVILSNTGDDNNPSVMDWGNGIVTESLVASLTGNVPAGLAGEQFGPIGYYTARDDMNPPDVTAWGVARGFPRKHVPEVTAVLTVGNFT